MKFDLTIGLATYDDWDGAFFTVESLFLHHDLRRLRAEVILVDNHPDGPRADSFRNYAAAKSATGRFRYIPMPDPVGTAPPRDRIFREAAGDVVCVLDSHVLLGVGAPARILDFFDAHPGPALINPVYLTYDGKGFMTHFEPVWQGGMWGVWATDLRARWSESEPFEVPACGLGAFACRKADWPGFHPLARGFGGEECYIHEKFRRRGGKTLCLPGFRVVHRFHDQTRPTAYPNRLVDRARNYLLEFMELGLDPAPIRRHFVEEMKALPAATFDALEVRTAEEWQLFLGGRTTPPPTLSGRDEVPQPEPESPSPPSAAASPRPDAGCRQCGQPSIRFSGGEEWLDFERRTVPQTAAVLDALREAAKEEREIVHLWASASAAAALLADPRTRYVAVVPDAKWWIGQASRVQLPGVVQWIASDPVRLPAPGAACAVADFLTSFPEDALRSPESAVRTLRQAAAAERIIVVGAENGATPGMESPIRAAVRYFVREHPEWRVIRYETREPGLAILSRRAADAPPLPSLVTQIKNFAQAAAVHVSGGAKRTPPALLQARLDACALCERRIVEGDRQRCAECGCYLTGGVAGSGGKAEWLDQDCPLGKWPSPKAFGL